MRKTKMIFVCLLLLAAACLWGQTDLQQAVDKLVENARIAADSVHYSEDVRRKAVRTGLEHLGEIFTAGRDGLPYLHLLITEHWQEFNPKDQILEYSIARMGKIANYDQEMIKSLLPLLEDAQYPFRSIKGPILGVLQKSPDLQFKYDTYMDILRNSNDKRLKSRAFSMLGVDDLFPISSKSAEFRQYIISEFIHRGDMASQAIVPLVKFDTKQEYKDDLWAIMQDKSDRLWFQAMLSSCGYHDSSMVAMQIEELCQVVDVPYPPDSTVDYSIFITDKRLKSYRGGPTCFFSSIGHAGTDNAVEFLSRIVTVELSEHEKRFGTYNRYVIINALGRSNHPQALVTLYNLFDHYPIILPDGTNFMATIVLGALSYMDNEEAARFAYQIYNKKTKWTVFATTTDSRERLQKLFAKYEVSDE